MLIILSDEHKAHLQFLSSVPLEVVAEFGKIALEFIRKGGSQKLYSSAAQKLGVPAMTIQNAVEGLIYLLTESAKLQISEVDFLDSVLILGFNEELNRLLYDTYVNNRKEIRNILSAMSMALPSYQDLDWRIDVQLASRSLRNQTVPNIILKLDTKDSGGVIGSKVESTILQTDPAGLAHITSVLEGALGELKSGYTRRIQRNIR
eukprot:Colp12_sorted_trinity150504_noHs@27186